MNTVIHEVPFSFEQPEPVLSALHKLVQQRLRQPPTTKISRDMIVRNALNILVIDMYQERAQYTSNLLLTVGYRPVIAANALDAFTLFLQGECTPLAIVMGQEDGSNRLFLTRLQQQLMQRYDWEPLLIRLTTGLQANYQQQAGFQQPAQNQYFGGMQPPTNTLSGMNTSPLGSGRPTNPPASGPHAQSSFPGQTPFAGQSPFADTPAWPGLQPPVPRNPPRRDYESQQPAGQVPFPPFETRQPSSPSIPQQSFQDELPNIPAFRDIQQSSAQSIRSTFSDVQNMNLSPAPDTLPPYEFEPEPAIVMPPGVLSDVPARTPAPQERTEKTLPGKKEKVYLDGQSLGRFQVRARLGSSPYSEIYQIYDRLREKDCALKSIQIDIVPFYMMSEALEDISVFQQESDLLGQLKHPHILPVLNCGKTYVSGANFIYKSMPLCSDGNLGTWLQRYGKPGAFAFKDIVPIILQLADALMFAHNFQVTYQNFKMNNILVLTPTKKIQKIEVALSDFSVVQDGSFLSNAPESQAYIAPERWEGIVSAASDQYGLAAIAYELFTGRPPFQANSEQIMKLLHTTRLPQPPSSLNPKLPNGLNAVLLRALAKNPQDRFPSMQHFMQALQQC